MNRTLMLTGFAMTIVVIIVGAVFLRGNADSPVAIESRAGIGGAPPSENEVRRDTEIERNIVEELAVRGNFTIFLESLRALGMLEKMSGPERFTVFAPTDESFVNVRSDILYPIMTDREALRQLVNSHIIRGELRNDELNEGGLVNLEGNELEFGDGRLEDAFIQESDIETTNGIIHAVSGLVMPQAMLQTVTPTGSIE